MEEKCRPLHLLSGTWNDLSYAFLVGFFHDFGKPFVHRLNCLGHQVFTGHAQVGARLFMLRFAKEIPEQVLLTMGCLIDIHMCCLQKNTSAFLRANAVLQLYLPSLPSLMPLLKCLHQADQESRQPSGETRWMPYEFFSAIPFRKERKIVIFLIGPSGSGKTTIAQSLTHHLTCHGSVVHLERDQVLMEFAEAGETYSQCYDRIHKDPILKKEFQARWKACLASTSADIVLVDTVQTYYWSQTMEYDAWFRIGIYCVPLHLMNASLQGKSPHPDFPPSKWNGYPRLLTEANSWGLEVATGLWTLVPRLVERYLRQEFPDTLDNHPSLASMYNHTSLECIKAQFPHESIQIQVEYEQEYYKIYRATYRLGSDVTWAATRFYRGEFMLMNYYTWRMMPLRSGLPTFTCKKTTLTPFDTVVVTPKFDGSLVNILFVPLQHPCYKVLQDWLHPDENAYGLFLVGSKQKLLMDSRLRHRFEVAIGTSFDEFIEAYASYFETENHLRTFHFEMRTRKSCKELTVYYPHNFCKFIGFTTCTEKKQWFRLAKPSDPRAVDQHTFETREAYQAYLAEQHQQFLNGDTSCEPEGHVLYFWDAQGRLLDVAKQKYPEYLAVTNPQKYPKEYQTLLTQPLLVPRFLKCRHLKTLIQPDALRKALREFLAKDTKDKREFAQYLNENEDKLQELQKQLDEIFAKAHMKARNIRREMFAHYPFVQKMVANIFRSLDDIVE